MGLRSEIENWTYSNDPSKSNKDAVRYTIGDIISNDKQMTDCEINYLLDTEGSVLEASICAVIGLIAMYSRDFNDNETTQSREVAENYRELLKVLLDKREKNIEVLIDSGAILESDKCEDKQDPDVVQPMFNRELFDTNRNGREYE